MCHDRIMRTTHFLALWLPDKRLLLPAPKPGGGVVCVAGVPRCAAMSSIMWCSVAAVHALPYCAMSAMACTIHEAHCQVNRADGQHHVIPSRCSGTVCSTQPLQRDPVQNRGVSRM